MRGVLLKTGFYSLSTVIAVTASIIALAEVNHWSLNRTTCMPAGFYQRGTVPKHLKIGDRVFFCPPVNSPSMRQAMSGAQPVTQPAPATVQSTPTNAMTLTLGSAGDQ